MFSLNDDCLALILSELPIASLLQVRCVSKSFQVLIDSATSERPATSERFTFVELVRADVVYDFGCTRRVVSRCQLKYVNHYPDANVCKFTLLDGSGVVNIPVDLRLGRFDKMAAVNDWTVRSLKYVDAGIYSASDRFVSVFDEPMALIHALAWGRYNDLRVRFGSGYVQDDREWLGDVIPTKYYINN